MAQGEGSANGRHQGRPKSRAIASASPSPLDHSSEEESDEFELIRDLAGLQLSDIARDSTTTTTDSTPIPPPSPADPLHTEHTAHLAAALPALAPGAARAYCIWRLGSPASCLCTLCQGTGSLVGIHIACDYRAAFGGIVRCLGRDYSYIAGDRLTRAEPITAVLTYLSEVVRHEAPPVPHIHLW